MIEKLIKLSYSQAGIQKNSAINTGYFFTVGLHIHACSNIKMLAFLLLGYFFCSKFKVNYRTLINPQTEFQDTTIIKTLKSTSYKNLNMN